MTFVSGSVRAWDNRLVIDCAARWDVRQCAALGDPIMPRAAR
jgi:hypothetical protein